MVIQVPLSNLAGTQDNGFANISFGSENPREREVLVNPFNTFKVLSFSPMVTDEEMIVHIIFLQYGSLKPIEEKIKKSDKLLDS